MAEQKSEERLRREEMLKNKGSGYYLLSAGMTLHGRVVRDQEIVPAEHMPDGFVYLSNEDQIEKYGSVRYQKYEPTADEKRSLERRLKQEGITAPTEQREYDESVRKHKAGYNPMLSEKDNKRLAAEDADDQRLAIEEMSTSELRAEGKKEGLSFPKGMKREQMVGALQKVKAANAAEAEEEDEEDEDVEEEPEETTDSDEDEEELDEEEDEEVTNDGPRT